jgi:branched-subunit amino acid transport protein
MAPMSSAWLVVVLVGAGTALIKAAGPVLLGGRPLPERVDGVIGLMAPAVLGALVAVNTFGQAEALVLDERVLGVAAAGIALWRKAPILVVVLAAAAVTALARAVQ